LRIAIVSHEYPPFTAYTGGIGRMNSTLAPALARAGHRVEVVTITRDEPRTLEDEGVRVHLVRRPTPDRLWFVDQLPWSYAVDRALRRRGNFDVVFAPEWFGEAARYSGHKRNGPLVTLLTTSLEQVLEIVPEWKRGRRMRIRHRVQRVLERRQTERSDAIIASSRAIGRWTSKLWEIADKPGTVLPNMVDVQRVQSIARAGELPDGFPADGPVLAFAGRLELRKGVHVLLDAMKDVWAAHPDAHLVMLGHDGDWGKGRMSTELRARAGRFAEHLHILGNHPPERLYPALEAADFVVMPSLWENFALTALEVLALGRPLVATSGSGYDDFISSEENGLLVPPRETAPLAEAIRRLLSDASLRERLSRGASDRIQELDVPPVTARHVEFFEQVASGTVPQTLSSAI
jgi:glycogen synthase